MKPTIGAAWRALFLPAWRLRLERRRGEVCWEHHRHGEGFEWCRPSGGDRDRHQPRNQRHQEMDHQRGGCLQRNRPYSWPAHGRGVSRRLQDVSCRIHPARRECQRQSSPDAGGGTCRGTGERDRSCAVAAGGADEPGTNGHRSANRAVADRTRAVQPTPPCRRRLAAGGLYRTGDCGNNANLRINGDRRVHRTTSSMARRSTRRYSEASPSIHRSTSSRSSGSNPTACRPSTGRAGGGLLIAVTKSGTIRSVAPLPGPTAMRN